MQEPTKYSSRVVDIIVYLLMSVNLLISCVTYLNLSRQVDIYNERLTRVTNANMEKIAELTVQSASRGVELEKLISENEELTTKVSILSSKVDRIEGSYPFTTVYDLARIACQDYRDVDPALVLAVAYEESRFNPGASSGTALGLMQIDPKWHSSRADRLGVSNYFNPYENILLGVDYLHEIHQDVISQIGVDDWSYVLMIYNMGHSVAKEFYDQGTITDYAKSVMARYEEYRHVFTLLGDI